MTLLQLSCQGDLEYDLNSTTDQVKNISYNVKPVSNKVILTNKNLSNTLKALNSNQSKANDNDESARLVVTESGLTTDTNQAIYLESMDGVYHSYTFPVIEESTENNIINNILVSLQPDSSYRTFLVTYNLPIEIKNQIDAGEAPDITEYTTYTDIENLNLSDILTGKVHYNPQLNYCYELHQEVSAGTGWIVTVEVEVPCPPGVGNNSSGGGGTTGEPEEGGGNGETHNPHELDGEGNNNFPGDGHGSGGPGTGNNNSGNSTGTSNATVLIDNITAMQINVLNLLNLSEITEDTVNNQNVIDWIKDDLNAYQLKRVQTFLQDHEASDEAIAFAMEAIRAFEGQGFSDLLELDVFNQDPYNIWGKLTEQEKALISSNPFKAYKIFKNKSVAEAETINNFGTNGINDKSDAFRHAFFQAINSRDVGISYAGQMSDAHESETPNRWLLEKQMDLFNNEYGLVIGDDYSNFNNQQLSDLIYQAIINGNLKYLHPINYNDINFWDNLSTQEPNDGTHGIINSTQLISTNL